MKQLALLAALLLAACGSETQAPVAPVAEAAAPTATTASAGDALTATGWGPLRIGMSKAEVIAAVGDTKTPDAAGIPGSDCVEFQPAQAPDGLWVMIEGDRLTRITIGDLSEVKDASGLGLGDTAAKVKETHGGKAQASPHKYQDAPAEYIAVWEGGPRGEPFVEDAAARGLVYEIDGTGNVGAIHAGGPSIQYVEGCA